MQNRHVHYRRPDAQRLRRLNHIGDRPFLLMQMVSLRLSNPAFPIVS